MSEPLRVVLADDSYLVREGTRELLEATGEIRVVATVSNADELLSAVEKLQPDAVVTDIRMPPNLKTEGIEAAHQIKKSHPGIGVVVLSQYADEAYAHQLLKNGSSGFAYLLKERVGDRVELVRAIKTTVAGGSVVDPLVVDALVRRTSARAQSPLRHLTEREHSVLGEMAQGKNNAAIGEALALSESSVEKHVNAIFTKLGLREEPTLQRRVAAVLTYLRETD